MSFFGRNIKKIRAAKKLSQTAFADLFNIKRASIGAYEEGRAEAKIDKIIEIAKHFKLTLNQLLAKELTLNEIYHINDLKNKNTKSYNEIPFVSKNNLNNYLEKHKNKKFVNSLEKIIIPDSNNYSIAFEYLGKQIEYSYYNIKYNDIIICESVKIKNVETIKKNSLIVVISESNLFVGKYSIINNKLNIIYNNTTYTSDEIKLDKIESLYVVKKIIFQSV